MRVLLRVINLGEGLQPTRIRLNRAGQLAVHVTALLSCGRSPNYRGRFCSIAAAFRSTAAAPGQCRTVFRSGVHLWATIRNLSTFDLTHGDFGGNVRALYSSEQCCL